MQFVFMKKMYAKTQWKRYHLSAEKKETTGVFRRYCKAKRCGEISQIKVFNQNLKEQVILHES